MILGLLQLFVQAGWQLLIVRLLLGVAIGAEYAIGPAMMAELSPRTAAGSGWACCRPCGTSASWARS